VRACRWEPGDPDAAQEAVTLLMRAGAGFAWIEHMGAAAPLQIWYLGREMAAAPGDWITWDGDGIDVADPVMFAALTTVPGGGRDRM